MDDKPMEGDDAPLMGMDMDAKQAEGEQPPKEAAKIPETDCCCCHCCDCCGCRKLWEKSEGRIFCCCCPLLLGVLVISATALFIAVYLTIEGFFLFFNAFIDWYYILVGWVLLWPLYFAVYWFIWN